MWEMLIPVQHTCSVSGITQQAGLPVKKTLHLAMCKLGCSQFALPAAGRASNGSESLRRRQGLQHGVLKAARGREMCSASAAADLGLIFSVESNPTTHTLQGCSWAEGGCELGGAARSGGMLEMNHSHKALLTFPRLFLVVSFLAYVYFQAYLLF